MGLFITMLHKGNLQTKHIIIQHICNVQTLVFVYCTIWLKNIYSGIMLNLNRKIVIQEYNSEFGFRLSHHHHINIHLLSVFLLLRKFFFKIGLKGMKFVHFCLLFVDAQSNNRSAKTRSQCTNRQYLSTNKAINEEIHHKYYNNFRPLRGNRFDYDNLLSSSCFIQNVCLLPNLEIFVQNLLRQ